MKATGTTKILVFAVALTMILLGGTSVFAAGSVHPGATSVDWNLSGAVMPNPPWGQYDIPGSDTSSKLIMNQPNGNVEVTLTGDMNGLNPDTTYTVYLSNGYLPTWEFKLDKTWIFNNYGTNGLTGSIANKHAYTVTAESSTGYGSLTFSGNAHYPATGSTSIYELFSGTISGSTISWTTTQYTDSGYTQTNGYSYTVTGTIAQDGSMSGTFSDSDGHMGYSWSATAGTVFGYPGLFNGYPTFTFTTDSTGSGSWHVNLYSTDFPTTGSFTLSVWINQPSPAATVLISDNFSVTVD